MSGDETNTGRRRFLTAATTVVGAVGTGFLLVPFISSMQPSAKARAAGAPVRADISKLEPGQMIRVKWRGKPVWVVKRTSDMLDTLASLNDRLRDPESAEPQQPAYAQNEYRSIKPEVLVLIGICTHLGCSPTYLPMWPRPTSVRTGRAGSSAPVMVPASTLPGVCMPVCRLPRTCRFRRTST